MQTPTTTRTLTPGELTNDGWFRTICVTGIGTTHELWANESGDEAVYVAAPDGGPVGAISRWARAPREFPAWIFEPFSGGGPTQFDQQVEAEDYVIAEARAEVRAELAS